MIISLSIFPIVLLLVCNAICVDVHNSKQVPREHLDIDTEPYNLNHPPLADEFDTPVTVLYDDYEVKEANNTKSVLDESDNSEGHNKVSIDSDEIITRESLKPKARALSVGSKFTVVKAEDSAAQSSIDNTSNNRRRAQRGRLQQVRKTKVNDNETKVETDESTTIKVVKKIVNTYTTQKPVSQTPADRQQSTTIKSQKRTRTRDPVIPIIESENYVYSHRGNFHYSYEGGDGTRAFEKGELKKSEFGSGMGEAVVGSYSYTDKDGNDFSLSYTADENGYRPVGAHLPTPPPIPPEIQAALRLLATKTTPEPVTERVKKS